MDETDSDEEDGEWDWHAPPRLPGQPRSRHTSTTSEQVYAAREGLLLGPFQQLQRATQRSAARRLRQFGRCVRQVVATACDDLVASGPALPRRQRLGKWHTFLTDADYHACATAEAFFWLDAGVRTLAEGGGDGVSTTNAADAASYAGITLNPGLVEAMPYSQTAASRQAQRLAHTFLRVTQMRLAHALADLVTANTAWLAARLHDTRPPEAFGGNVTLDVFEAAFKAMDLDGSGELDEEEVQGLMRLLYVRMHCVSVARACVMCDNVAEQVSWQDVQR